jgi:hypothetical protein
LAIGSASIRVSYPTETRSCGHRSNVWRTDPDPHPRRASAARLRHRPGGRVRRRPLPRGCPRRGDTSSAPPRQREFRSGITDGPRCGRRALAVSTPADNVHEPFGPHGPASIVDSSHVTGSSILDCSAGSASVAPVGRRARRRCRRGMPGCRLWRTTRSWREHAERVLGAHVPQAVAPSSGPAGVIDVQGRPPAPTVG